ncbi:MAG: DUF1330 domain-containing protein [Woeseiaceae bacterium]
MTKTVMIGLLSLACIVGCERNAEIGQDVTAGYVVANFRITDPKAYASYPPAAVPTLIDNGAQILVADLESEAIEGQPDHVTLVIRFPSKDAARAWYSSAEYQDIIHLRTDNIEGQIVLADAFAAPK